MALQAYDTKGKRVNVGDVVTYGEGSPVVLESVTRSTYPGKSGKVVVCRADHLPNT